MYTCMCSKCRMWHEMLLLLFQWCFWQICPLRQLLKVVLQGQVQYKVG